MVSKSLAISSHRRSIQGRSRRSKIERAPLYPHLVLELGKAAEQDPRQMALFSVGNQFLEHECESVCQSASFRDRSQLLVDILGIAVFAGAHGADGDDAIIFINAVDDAMASELVFPIARERRAQR